MRFTRTLITIFVFLTIVTPAFAQRLIPGQWVLTAGGEAGVISPVPAGGEVSFNRVNYASKMICKIVATTDKKVYNSAEHSALPNRNIDIYASWGYHWNLYHNRSRSFNIWAGSTVDVGARVRKYLGDEGNGSLIPGLGFLYGFSPEINFEFFPAKKFSMSVFARPHLQFYTRGSDYSSDGSEAFFYPVFGLQFNFYTFVGK